MFVRINQQFDRWRLLSLENQLRALDRALDAMPTLCRMPESEYTTVILALDFQRAHVQREIDIQRASQQAQVTHIHETDP